MPDDSLVDRPPPAVSLADDHGLSGLPATFIIDPTGRLVYRFLGYTNERLLSRALDEVLSEAPA